MTAAASRDCLRSKSNPGTGQAAAGQSGWFRLTRPRRNSTGAPIGSTITALRGQGQGKVSPEGRNGIAAQGRPGPAIPVDGCPPPQQDRLNNQAVDVCGDRVAPGFGKTFTTQGWHRATSGLCPSSLSADNVENPAGGTGPDRGVTIFSGP